MEALLLKPTMNDPTPQPAPLSTDFSALNDFCDCERYYFNRYVRQIVPIDYQPSLALLIGEGMHRARKLYAETGGDLESALAEFSGFYEPVWNERELHATGGDRNRTPYVGRSLLHAYHQKWGAPADLHTEVGFHLDMNGYEFYGRIDYITERGGLTVVDLKSTSSLQWLPQARLNWQLVGYAYATQEMLGLKPEYVAIDAIVIPRLSKRLEANMPPEWEFALTLHDNLHYRIATIQPRDLDEWRRWLESTLARVQLCHDLKEWTMRAPRACQRFYGTCAYDPLCKAASPDQEEQMVERLYKIEVWHPFEGNGGGE